MDTFLEQICVVELLHDQDGKARSEMSKKTHTNPLSRREVEQLCNNPHIASVSTTTVRFTEEFKQLAYDRKLKGISVVETMRQCGINPEVLGESRVSGFCYQLNKKAKQEGGFTDGRSENYPNHSITPFAVLAQASSSPRRKVSCSMVTLYLKMLWIDSSNKGNRCVSSASCSLDR